MQQNVGQLPQLGFQGIGEQLGAIYQGLRNLNVLGRLQRFMGQAGDLVMFLAERITQFVQPAIEAIVQAVVRVLGQAGQLVAQALDFIGNPLGQIADNLAIGWNACTEILGAKLGALLPSTNFLLGAIAVEVGAAMTIDYFFPSSVSVTAYTVGGAGVAGVIAGGVALAVGAAVLWPVAAGGAVGGGVGLVCGGKAKLDNWWVDRKINDIEQHMKQLLEKENVKWDAPQEKYILIAVAPAVAPNGLRCPCWRRAHAS